MRVALIATVYNEHASIHRWVDALRSQSRIPDEFVIVDGGSTDGTPELIRRLFEDSAFTQPRILVERCNIARGRNLAIQNTSAEIIVSTDAGSFPAPDWLQEISRPLLEDASADVTGGRSVLLAENPFQHLLIEMEGQPPEEDAYYPSSRNIAIRRKAWESIGGYPEWLTLAGEDALYNFELHATGMKVIANPKARVQWLVRTTAEDYLHLRYRNAFGAAEATLFTSYFLRSLLITLFPALLLLSKYRFAHLGFRYRKNAASALGWLAGKVRGNRRPKGWKRINGILLSPEAQAVIRARQ